MLLTKESDRRDNNKYGNFEYKKINTIKTDRTCYSFSFNTNNTILFVGQNCGMIKAYGFNNQIKLIQKLILPDSCTVCMIWRKKSNSLISGNFYEIIIWEYNQSNQLNPVQILKPEQKDLHCMILNEDEEILVSGSSDKLQFWKKASNGWICSQMLQTPICAECLSFSSQNKLISCGSMFAKYKEIQVIECQSNQNWIITQTIPVNTWQVGKRICFLNDNQFAYQPNQEDFLEIYEYKHENKQFVKVQQVQIKYSEDCLRLFPSQFINERNILMVKQGKYINYFRMDQNGNAVLQYTIEFESQYLYGRLSNDGLYQVDWDLREGYIQRQFDIQIRKVPQLIMQQIKILQFNNVKGNQQNKLIISILLIIQLLYTVYYILTKFYLNITYFSQLEETQQHNQLNICSNQYQDKVQFNIELIGNFVQLLNRVLSKTLEQLAINKIRDNNPNKEYQINKKI